MGTHIRDVLGINKISQAKPIQAAFASLAAFTAGGLLPFLVTLFMPLNSMEYSLYLFALFFLIILGALAAKTGGSSIGKAIIRITFWGTLAPLNASQQRRVQGGDVVIIVRGGGK